MRLLHILEATGGGTRRHVLDLLPALQEKGVSCSLIYSPLRNPRFASDAQFLQSKNIEATAIAMGHSYQRAGDANALRALYAHLKNNEYDLIHCHSSNAGMLGRLANALCRKRTPLVYTPHLIAFAAGLPPLQRRSARWIEKILAPQTSHFIAVSHHEYAILKRARLLKNQNASVIHNGINAELFTHHPSPITHHLTLSCFGRLTPQKNQQLLIRALPKIAREIPDARLRLIGDGEDETALRALAKKLRFDHRVEFRGDVRDVALEYSRCDIALGPSRWEGCSYALLEAMAAGKTIVASRCGGNPEVMGESGVLQAAHDAPLWAQTIIDLARDEDRRRELGRAARERVTAHFRLETMAEKTLDVYERVLQ